MFYSTDFSLSRLDYNNKMRVFELQIPIFALRPKSAEKKFCWRQKNLPIMMSTHSGLYYLEMHFSKEAALGTASLPEFHYISN